MGAGHRRDNLERGAALVSGFLAAGGSCDVIVFPEFAFDGPASALADPDAVVAGSAQEVFQRMALVAAEAGALVIAPAYVADGEQQYNGCLAVGTEGILAEYRKVHPYPPEQPVVSRGDRLVAVSAGDFVIGMQICYDLAFPEPARALALAGAEVLVYPTMAPEWLMRRFRILAAARAIENQVFIVVVNAVGTHPTSGEVLGGGSLVAFPEGTIQEMGREEAADCFELDRSLLADVRAGLDLIADRAPGEVYVTTNVEGGTDAG